MTDTPSYSHFVGYRVVERGANVPRGRHGVVAEADRRRVLVRWDDGAEEWRRWLDLQPEQSTLANVTVFR